jgi:hypothetical protein
MTQILINQLKDNKNVFLNYQRNIIVGKFIPAEGAIWQCPILHLFPIEKNRKIIINTLRNKIPKKKKGILFRFLFLHSQNLIK